MESKIYQDFLALVRVGIGNAKAVHLSDVDWREIQTIAELQGLYAIVLDGIEKLPENNRPKQELLLEWIGEVLQGYEYRYVAYKKTIAEMAAFYNSHGYKMMILKGYACSLDWPKPEHRPCGDIDIWQFGKQKEADKLLSKEKGFTIDTSEHQHTIFDWQGFTVENHFDFLNVHANKTNAKLEPVLKELAMNDAYYVEVAAEKVYFPSPNLNAIFLLRHMLMHFVAVGINIRTILDWGFFWQKHGKQVDLIWLDNILTKFRIKEFFNIINAICVEDLGFPSSIFPSVQFVPAIKERVLQDILSPEYNRKDVCIPNLLKRLVFKIKRWKASGWKRKLFLNENSYTILVWSIKSHLLKPKTI